ncbi:MAG: ABC-2 type transport system permease protein [Arenicella sp.]|jgi:ABC-2 type transport system permease protein
MNMRVMLALLKREILEHRNIWFTPVILIVVAILVRLSLIFGNLNIDSELPPQLMLDDQLSSVVNDVLVYGLNWMNYIITMTLMAAACFYTLSCLFNERQDESVLFWRSLPVSDTTTIVSKLLIALVVAPISVLICQVVVAFIFFGFGAFDYLAMYFGSSLTLLIKMIFWSLLPTVAWCLFCSEVAKKNPFLLAFIAPILLWVIDSLFLRSVIGDNIMLNRWFGFDSYTRVPLICGLVLSALFIIFATVKRSQRI